MLSLIPAVNAEESTEEWEELWSINTGRGEVALKWIGDSEVDVNGLISGFGFEDGTLTFNFGDPITGELTSGLMVTWTPTDGTEQPMWSLSDLISNTEDTEFIYVAGDTIKINFDAFGNEHSIGLDGWEFVPDGIEEFLREDITISKDDPIEIKFGAEDEYGFEIYGEFPGPVNVLEALRGFEGVITKDEDENIRYYVYSGTGYYMNVKVFAGDPEVPTEFRFGTANPEPVVFHAEEKYKISDGIDRTWDKDFVPITVDGESYGAYGRVNVNTGEIDIVVRNELNEGTITYVSNRGYLVIEPAPGEENEWLPYFSFDFGLVRADKEKSIIAWKFWNGEEGSPENIEIPLWWLPIPLFGEVKDVDPDNGGKPDFGETDTDGDGIPDELEVLLGLDPENGDTDEDGAPDGEDCAPLNPEKQGEGHPRAPRPPTGEKSTVTAPKAIRP